MRKGVVYIVLICLLMLGNQAPLGAKLYKGDARGKKELITGSETSPFMKPNSEDGLTEERPDELLFPNDGLIPEGDPIGMPVDGSLSIAAFITTLLALYLTGKRRSGRPRVFQKLNG